MHGRSRKCKKKQKQLSWQSFLPFWDLHTQKLLVERWWNWTLTKLNPGVNFTKLFPFRTIWQKICCSISPMIKTLNFELKFAHFLPNLLKVCQTLCAIKNLSSCASKKAVRVCWWNWSLVRWMCLYFKESWVTDLD